MTLEQVELSSRYKQQFSTTHLEQYAQVFTPPRIAQLMCNWITANPEIKEVLDPAFGLGVFANYLPAELKVTAFDVDEQVVSFYKKHAYKRKGLKLRLADYLDTAFKQYQGIIANPPYLKFHDYDNAKATAKLAEATGIKLSKMSNLYVLFLVRSLAQLAPNGRLVYIVPSEFLNSDYGVAVKQYLIDTGYLRHIAVLSHDYAVFDNALTTACLLFCANDEYNHSECSFSLIEQEADLEKLEFYFRNYPQNHYFNFRVKAADLNAELKWRNYYTENHGTKFRNLVPFTNYAKVSRGIATGANEYFTFSQGKALAYNLANDNLVPCICRSKDVENPFFTDEAFAKLRDNNQSVFLFNASVAITPSVSSYLAVGEGLGVHKKYLTSMRKPWYALEKRKVAPIWVSVFNRTGLKFIRNEAEVLHLTTFHGVYPSYPDIDLFFAYLCTDTAKEILNHNRREYGSGLNKFEPNDLNKAQMLDIDLLPQVAKQKILELYQQYRSKAIKGKVDESYLIEIDRIFIENFEVVAS